MKKTAESQALAAALEALQAYADPEFYHAVTVIADSPAGGFAKDFNRVGGSGYNRPMPGKRARRVLKRIQRLLYPVLLGCSLHSEDNTHPGCGRPGCPTCS